MVNKLQTPKMTVKNGRPVMVKRKKPSPKWHTYAIGAGVVVVAALAFIILDPSQTELRAFETRVKQQSAEDDKSAKPPFEENERRLAGRDFAQPFSEPTNPPLSHFDAVHNNSLLWGTYASHMYLGLRTRSPQGVVTGLGWAQPRGHQLRVDCDQNDRLGKYGWERHNGRDFGKQTIEDGDLTLDTSFLKYDGKQGGNWAVRIVPKGVKGVKSASVLWTVALESAPEAGSLSLENDASGRITGPVHLKGNSPDIGDFSIVILPHSGDKKSKTSFLGIDGVDKLDALRDALQSNLRKKAQSQAHANFPNTIEEDSNLFSFQVDLFLPGDVTIVMINHATLGGSPSNGDIVSKATQYQSSYTRDLSAANSKFDKKFSKTFGLDTKGFTADDLNFAKSALGNLLGGMAYFYGESIVEQGTEKKDSFSAPLFSAVPSRSFFPRGFLWDEGFHELLIARWDPEIAKDALGHWLQVMHSDGWIPREQILGDVARSKVPDEFVVQNSINANPPTLLLVFEQLFLGNGQQELSGPDADFLSLSFSRLRAWFSWLLREQAGSKADSFYWRGRDVTQEVDEQGAPKRLNPRTLASGLDDYPRALFPTSNERHVDLTCWVIRSARIMAGLARALGQDPSEFESIQKRVASKLNEYHWDVSAQEYRDWGKHAKIKSKTVNNKRVAAKAVDPKTAHHQFINTGPGYVSLFPMLLKILSPDAPQLGPILKLIKDPNHLWSPAGLRSISKRSPFYNLGNSEHDKPYWRGQVWININYLALDALHHYASVSGPYQSQARSLYDNLKSTVVGTVARNYNEQGYLFEQYTDEGVGSGCLPFAGWSALATLAMADLY